jgi:hypothetical protein
MSFMGRGHFGFTRSHVNDKLASPDGAIVGAALSMKMSREMGVGRLLAMVERRMGKLRDEI